MAGTLNRARALMTSKWLGISRVMAMAALVWAFGAPTVSDLHAVREYETESVVQRSNGRCDSIAGSISTNFITEDTTLGTVTGDLVGGISATLLELTPGANGKVIARIQHRGWVTEPGDALRVAEALLDLTPVSEGVFYANYRPIRVAGGTGRFRNATGTILAYGVLDTNRGEVVLRYRGNVCSTN
jgi:hypothetical protein